MALRAAARRRAQQRAALPREARRMRVRAGASQRSHRVAARAVALGVARDARLKRAPRLHRVVLERHVGARKHRERRVKSAGAPGGGRRRQRDSCAPMAALAEGLLAMAAPAAVGRHSRFDPVKGQVVVGVRSTIAHPSVVTVDALALAVTRGARGWVGLRDRAVIHPEISVVPKPVHPRRRVEPPLFEARAQHAVCFGEVTARATSRCAALLVTARALAHRR